MTASQPIQPIALMWENFGPYHHDRARAVYEAGIPVVAIQLFGQSEVYDWGKGGKPLYPMVTLAPHGDALSTFRLASRLVRAVQDCGARECYFCHYEKPAVLLAATWLRLRGHRVVTMVASKYDDYPRIAWRERLKRLFMLPYAGAIVGSDRSRDYVAKLGIPGKRALIGYDTVDIVRVGSQGEAPAPPRFSQRPFLIVSRLVEKKNIPISLRAFARYVREQQDGRRLEIMGEGPLRQDAEALAVQLGIADRIDFRGHQDSPAVSEAMRRSLALLLPSISEQFGLVVNEAFANGLPVIVSTNAGAVDVLVDEGENGIVVNPYSEDELLAAMTRVASDEHAWRKMSAAAKAASPRGDVRRFVQAVKALSRLNA